MIWQLFRVHKMTQEEFLKIKLSRLFMSGNDREIVEKILDRYGIESHEQEPVRVRLAILKLSGNEILEIEKWT